MMYIQLIMFSFVATFVIVGYFINLYGYCAYVSNPPLYCGIRAEFFHRFFGVIVPVYGIYLGWRGVCKSLKYKRI